MELFFKKLEADEQARRVLKQQKKPAANDCTIETIAVSMSEEYPEHKKPTDLIAVGFPCVQSDKAGQRNYTRFFGLFYG